MHVRVFKPARAALPLAVYDGHGQAATYYCHYAAQAATFTDNPSARPQEAARSAERPAASLSLRDTA